MSTVFTAIISLFAVITRSTSSKYPPPSTSCTITIIDVQDDGTFEFDPKEMDRLLKSNDDWDDESFAAAIVKESNGDGTDIVDTDLSVTLVRSGDRGFGTFDEALRRRRRRPASIQHGQELAILGEPLNCKPCASFTCQSVDGGVLRVDPFREMGMTEPEFVKVFDGTGGITSPRRLEDTYTGPQCSFDIADVDEILGTPNWIERDINLPFFLFQKSRGGRQLRQYILIYNHRTMETEIVDIFRRSNGGSKPESNQGYLEYFNAEDAFRKGDKLSIVGRSTVCDVKCQIGYPLLNEYLNECSQYGMDRVNIQKQLNQLKLGFIALSIQNKILLQLLASNGDDARFGKLGSSDSSDSSDSGGKRKRRPTSKSSPSTYRKLDAINAYLEIMTNDVSLEDMGMMGRILGDIQKI